MNLSKYIENFCGKECWSVIAGDGTGSVVHLGFGEKIPRDKPLKNNKLSSDQKNYKAEFSLMVFCAWRVIKKQKIICGWRDSNEVGGDMLRGLDLLKDRKLISFNLSDIGYDLDMLFEGGVRLQLFSDLTNDYESDENYTIFVRDKAFSVGIKSVLQLDET